MRAITLSVWIFINLVFFGMCGYMYLLWTQYWHYRSKQQDVQKQHKKIENKHFVDYYQEQIPIEILNMQRIPVINVQSTTQVNRRKKPRFKGQNRKKILSNCENCDNNNIVKRIAAFKKRILIRLRTVLHDESNVYISKSDNPYNVYYDGLQQSAQVSKKKLLCRLKKLIPKVKTITGRENAFLKTPLSPLVPKFPLFGDYEYYNNCAIVSNAGALLGSNLGNFIDSHDLVLRFNHAPTNRFENDVGQKTTIRILNSQVVSKKEFKFLKSNLYENIKLLAWDPCNYTATLKDWREKPDFDIFTPYVQHRLTKPDTNFHLLDPRILWDLWNFVQSHTSVRIRKNPPSSGLLGLTLLLPFCEKIRMMEYVPSIRLTPKCHYFDREIDTSCTFGVWHPLAAEKLIAIALNEENDLTTFDSGYITISGFNTLKC